MYHLLDTVEKIRKGVFFYLVLKLKSVKNTTRDSGTKRSITREVKDHEKCT